MTQNERILSALKRGDLLTPMRALNRFKCFRLAARIRELRDEGHKIQSRVITTPKKARHAVYWM